MKKFITTLLVLGSLVVLGVASSASASTSGAARTVIVRTSDVATNPITVNLGAHSRFSLRQLSNPHEFLLRIVTGNGTVIPVTVEDFVSLRVSRAS